MKSLCVLPALFVALCVAPDGLATDYPVGLNAQAVATGDLTGNGNMDIVVAGSGQNGVQVLLGQNNGTFIAQPLVPLPSAISSIAIADFNGDSKQDVIALAVGGYATFYILIGNGDGTFARLSL